eukprot:TRINITY_DN18374_c0_g1_i1.p2 TRINITY_DN18374_c0_g1~~TRINITY_DN18374_c0_g1_i1.p2  ORF type:complete len:132 (-),score=4.57 TRINITY_DN18374_c0_g1_i1:426-821(-)
MSQLKMRGHLACGNLCSASCGSTGIRTRNVKCKWKNELELPSESIEYYLCESGLPKPKGTQACSHDVPCSGESPQPPIFSLAPSSSHINATILMSGDCTDASQYCGLIYSFKLCNLPKYKEKCCNSCSSIL